MGARPKFEESPEAGTWHPVCQHCGSTDLHHDAVVVYGRTGEDKGGVVTVVTGYDGTGREASVRTTPASAEEMPGRRDSVEVYFWCEGCGFGTVLGLLQHKGKTLITAEQQPPAGEEE